MTRVDTAIPAGAEFGIRFLARGIDTLYWMALYFVTAFGSGIVFVVLSSLGVLPENWIESMGKSRLGASSSDW